MNEQLRDALIKASLKIGHQITDHKITLFSDMSKEGNALSQLADRLVQAVIEVQPPQGSSAEHTLKMLGYTDCGGELWKPPLGKPTTPVAEADLLQLLSAIDGMATHGTIQLRDENWITLERTIASLKWHLAGGAK